MPAQQFKPTEDRPLDVQAEVWARPVAEMGFSRRIRLGLARLGLSTAGELTWVTADDLMDCLDFHRPPATAFLLSSICKKDPGMIKGYIVRSSVPT